MSAERVCGRCIFGADAYDRYGNIDPNYVICQVKEAENRQRKPNRFQTTSAVSRMHYFREACVEWRENISTAPGEYELPQPISEPEPETPAPRLKSAPLDAQVQELNKLKLQVIQQDQMITSLQNQNLYLNEQNTELQQQLQQLSQKLENLQAFDPALLSEVNYFSLLGVSERASSPEIKEAYRKRMKFLHPDRFINIAQRLNVAYETLMDSDRRQKYLQQIHGQQAN